MRKLLLILGLMILSTGFASAVSSGEQISYDQFDDSFINWSLVFNDTSLANGLQDISENTAILNFNIESGGGQVGVLSGGTNNFADFPVINTYFGNITISANIRGQKFCGGTVGSTSGTLGAFGNNFFSGGYSGSDPGSFGDNSVWTLTPLGNGQISSFDDGVFDETWTMSTSNFTWSETVTGTSCSATTSDADLAYINYTLRKTVDVNLTTPLVNTFHSNEFINFSGDQATPTIPDLSFDLVNATLFVWDSTGAVVNKTTISITGTTNSTDFDNVPISTVGIYDWNILSCQTDDCDFADSNSSFTWGFEITSEEFDNSTTEGQLEDFAINITVGTGVTISSGNLNYNNTQFPGSIDQLTSTTYRLTRSLQIDNVATATNQTFFWELVVNGGNFNTTSHNQTVNVVSLDNCDTNTLLLYNLTLRDEEDQTFLNGASENTTIEVDVNVYTIGDRTQSIAQFSSNFTEINPAQVCFNSEALDSGDYEVDAVFRYESAARVSEFYNIRNFTASTSSLPQNIDLFDLKTADSQEFIITFKDDSFAPVEGAILTITRKYISEGVFKTVEQPITNEDGQGIGHLVITNAIYTIQVTKDSQILATFDNVVAFCSDITIGECSINLDSFSTGVNPTDYDTVNDLTYSMTFDSGTRTVTVIFSIPSGGVSLVSLDTTLFDNLGNTTVCADQLTSSSGTLTCLVPVSFGNSTVLSVLSKDGTLINSAAYLIKQDAGELFGGTGYLFVLLLYMTLPLMFITTGPGMIIGAVMGIIFAVLLNMFNTNNLIGVGSTLLWFVVAGGIIAWKMVKRE